VSTKTADDLEYTPMLAVALADGKVVVGWKNGALEVMGWLTGLAGIGEETDLLCKTHSVTEPELGHSNWGIMFRSWHSRPFQTTLPLAVLSTFSILPGAK
jgi:hypothetical protein